MQLSASVICLDLLALAEDIRVAEHDGIDRWHVDLIDGAYAANLGLPLGLIRRLRQITRLPIDAHLLVTRPEVYVEAVLRGGADTACVPVSAYADGSFLTSSCMAESAHLGLMIDRPPVDVALLQRLAPSKVTVMAARPGFTGQPFLPHMLDVIAELRSWRDARGEAMLIEVDGAVGSSTIGALVQAGADVLVLGSTAFGEGPLRPGTISAIREKVDAARLAAPFGALA